MNVYAFVIFQSKLYMGGFMRNIAWLFNLFHLFAWILQSSVITERPTLAVNMLLEKRCPPVIVCYNHTFFHYCLAIHKAFCIKTSLDDLVLFEVQSI